MLCFFDFCLRIRSSSRSSITTYELVFLSSDVERKGLIGVYFWLAKVSNTVHSSRDRYGFFLRIFCLDYAFGYVLTRTIRL
jgi:hypothetical protein